MSRSIVLKSFAELANVLDLNALPDGPAEFVAEETTPTVPAEAASDLAGLLAELEAASATLATGPEASIRISTPTIAAAMEAPADRPSAICRCTFHGASG